MPNYFDTLYNIILPEEYFKNIRSYTVNRVLTVKEKKYLETIQKDLLKDSFCAMIEKDVEIYLGENFSDYLKAFNSPYDYFLIDREDLEKSFKPVLHWILTDLVYYLDIEEAKKFDILYDFLRVEEEDYIIKVQRIEPNSQNFPFYDEEIDHMIECFEGYNYKSSLL